MGLLVAELPNGSVHAWRGRDRSAIQFFLNRFQRKLEKQMGHNSDSVRFVPGSSIAARLAEWVFGMTLHVISTPIPDNAEVQNFRKMFLTYRLLTLGVPLEAGHPGKRFADLLPDHDLEFRLSAPDGNFAFDFRIWPLGTADEIRLAG